MRAGSGAEQGGASRQRILDLADAKAYTADMGSNTSSTTAAGGGAVYGLGLFGAWFWFFGQADQFWEYVWAFFQGILWPAFFVYEAFRTFSG